MLALGAAALAFGVPAAAQAAPSARHGGPIAYAAGGPTADASQSTAAGRPTAHATQTTGVAPTTVPTAEDLPGPVAAPRPNPSSGVSLLDLSGWIPNDHVGDVPWTALQWNFAGEWGVGATRGWKQLRTSGAAAAGAAHVKIAVIDSGIAYRTQGRYRRSPDLPRTRVLEGYDFVDEDRYPDDLSGHGTHVASTIAAATDNDAGLTGLAYQADIVPVRVLNAKDSGDTYAIARGIRYAIRRQVDLINLSVDFPLDVTEAQIPDVSAAIEDARRRGILVIASSGNNGGRLDGRKAGGDTVALPAREPSVLAVGATTVRGCRAAYSNAGAGLDLMAPGGGHDNPTELMPRCQSTKDGPPIAQVTLLRANDPTTLGVPLDYVGTSMAAAHVTGVAAMVIASRILGRHPRPELLAAYLEETARDLGATGHDPQHGAGLVDAAAATAPSRGAAAAKRARRAVAAAKRAGLPGLRLR